MAMLDFKAAENNHIFSRDKRKSMRCLHFLRVDYSEQCVASVLKIFDSLEASA